MALQSRFSGVGALAANDAVLMRALAGRDQSRAQLNDSEIALADSASALTHDHFAVFSDAEFLCADATFLRTAKEQLADDRAWQSIAPLKPPFVPPPGQLYLYTFATCVIGALLNTGAWAWPLDALLQRRENSAPSSFFRHDTNAVQLHLDAARALGSDETRVVRVLYVRDFLPSIEHETLVTTLLDLFDRRSSAQYWPLFRCAVCVVHALNAAWSSRGLPAGLAATRLLGDLLLCDIDDTARTTRVYCRRYYDEFAVVGTPAAAEAFCDTTLNALFAQKRLSLATRFTTARGADYLARVDRHFGLPGPECNAVLARGVRAGIDGSRGTSSIFVDLHLARREAQATATEKIEHLTAALRLLRTECVHYLREMSTSDTSSAAPAVQCAVAMYAKCAIQIGEIVRATGARGDYTAVTHGAEMRDALVSVLVRATCGDSRLLAYIAARTICSVTSDQLRMVEVAADCVRRIAQVEPPFAEQVRLCCERARSWFKK